MADVIPLMDKPNLRDNPFESPHSSSLAATANGRKQEFRFGISWPLACAWLLAVFAIPVTGFYEEIVVNGDNPDFRLGWIHFVGPAIACALPFFTSTLIRYRFLYAILSIVAIIFMTVVSTILSIMIFGLTGIQ